MGSSRSKAPYYNQRSELPTTIDPFTHSGGPHRGDSAALVLDPIVDGVHLTRVPMDCSNNFNLLYADTVREMCINPAR